MDESFFRHLDDMRERFREVRWKTFSSVRTKGWLCPAEMHAYNTPDDHKGSWEKTLAEIRALPTHRDSWVSRLLKKGARA